MKTIIVDDNSYSLIDTRNCFEKIPGLQISGYFSSATAALDFVRNNPVELAILDVEMPVMNGIELAKAISEFDKKIQIIFLTGYDTFALQAYHLNVVSYLLKPCSLEDAKSAVERAFKLLSCPFNLEEPVNVQNPVPSANTQANTTTVIPSSTSDKPFIKTFGRFDVYINKIPIHFAYAKSKELLAIIVDAQGGTVSMEKAISMLWEDRPYDEKAKQLYRKTISILRKVLQDYNIEDICYFYRAGIAIDVTKIDCDLFRFLNGDTNAKKSYTGIYPPDYSWSEFTNAELERMTCNE